MEVTEGIKQRERCDLICTFKSSLWLHRLQVVNDGKRETRERAGEILPVWMRAVTVNMERSGQKRYLGLQLD